MKNEIGCVIVNYNTPKIISTACNSIKDHIDNVIIIDGSSSDNPSFLECDELEKNNNNIKVIHTNTNIYHGPGLHLGVNILIDKYIVCMDSDAELIDSEILNEMKNILDSDEHIYGCGKVVKVNEHGKNTWTSKNIICDIDYLHPYFCMFKKETYLKCNSFIHHGAPFISTMKQIKDRMKLINIEDVEDRCKHTKRVTRMILKKI